MNILFISHLSGKLSVGPCWSVPARIKAQAEMDNVYWLNWGNAELPHWLETGVFCKQNVGAVKLTNLPIPFNNPDIVIFEGFYSIKSARFAKQLLKNHIPYIINPRGSLTKQARSNESKWKKDLAHVIWFDKFIKNAASIQYLTKQEAYDSIACNNRFFILPNGFITPASKKMSFSKNNINVIFIGRIDVYHKGLDLLLSACRSVKDQLKAANVHFKFFGPLNAGGDKFKQMIADAGLSDQMQLMGETTGSNKEQELLKADVFVLTSRFEGHPMGLIEALAYGVPALVTEGTNMKEEIVNANAGWGCSTNENAVAKTLLQMIEEKSKFEEKSNCAYALAKNYNWPRLAEIFRERIKDVIR